MANFNSAFKLIIKHEGGYVNDKDDAGGETYMGISRKAHPQSDIWNIIDDIKSKCNNVSELNKQLSTNKTIIKSVKEIYKTQYWDSFKLDNMDSQKLANQIFDNAVNMGVSKTKKLIQRVKNEMQLV